MPLTGTANLTGAPGLTGLPDLSARFAAAMERLGPFEPRPRLAAAVSGGADSMALVLLADDWVRPRGGTVLALIVDHRLRAASSMEAAATLNTLRRHSIPARILTVADLPPGPALAERARAVRYRLLLEACAAEGIVHLLLGHHRGDQVETAMMRALSSSGTRGLSGMAALTEMRFARLLRPVLGFAPADLRALLIGRGIAWIEDPSNRNRAALRSRLRLARGDAAGTGEATLALASAVRGAGAWRSGRDTALACTLAGRAMIRPEGFALLTPGPLEPEALAALLRAIAGTPHAPPLDRVAALACDLRPATLGGVRIVAAGRFGPGWLLVRETRAMQGPVEAQRNAVWDGRFRLAVAPEGVCEAPVPDRVARPGPASLRGSDSVPYRAPHPDAIAPPDSVVCETSTDRGDGFAPGDDAALPARAARLTIGALGAEAVKFRNRTGLPALVMHGLPALRSNGRLLAVPHIGMGDPRWHLLFDPRNCVAGAPFLPGP